MEDRAPAFRQFKKPRSSWKTSTLMVVIALLCCAGLTSAAIDKEAAYQEMAGLANQMKTLKPQVRTNNQAAATYGILEARYQELSTALGGDDPGHVARGNRTASARAAARRVTRGAPLPPAGCGTATATFTQSTPTPITDIGVTTSTIVVSGAGSYLYDLDLTTFITHTFPGDLDITLTSPAGTVVTITTDNAGTNDDVYNGTVWDDDANPAGQVPYTTNDGLVTDHAYVLGTLASPLVPEEAMGAFVGENPNGTWTLTISDDTAVDTGTLASWSLGVTTFPNAPVITAVPTVTQSTPVTIPGGPAVVTSTLVVSGAGTSLLDVDMTTFITHTFPGDLDITLTSPAGTVVTITTDNAGTNDDVYNGTVWDDDANPSGQVPYTTNNGLVTDHAYVLGTLASPLVPEEAMGAFIGENPNGTWTLTISDDTAVDGGNLSSWSLDIDTFSCASADLSITKTDGITNVTAGGMTTYTIVASNAGPTAANPATVADTFPAGCASVSYTSTTTGGATGNTASGSGNINDTALNLPSGSTVTYTAICTISGSASGSLTNTATISSGTPDPNQGNNSATDTDTITVAADLSLTKTPSSSSVTVGSNVTYTLTVSNAGPAPATGVVVTDTLPAGLTYVSNDCGATFASPTLTWNVGNLAVSASATCHVVATVNTTGPIINTATATSNEGDPTPATSGAITIVGVITSPGIPTLNEVGLAILIGLLALSAAFTLRRKRQA